MFYNDLDFVRLVARERFEERLREADATRLAKEIRGTAPCSRGLRTTVRLTLGTSRRALRSRLEA